MQGQEWLLRCSTCKKVYAFVFVTEGSGVLWESPALLSPCHPTPSGAPGLEAVVKGEDSFKKVCRVMSGEGELEVHTQVSFEVHDGIKPWHFFGAS